MQLGIRQFCAALAALVGIFLFAGAAMAASAAGEDGYRLWLRYAPIEPAKAQTYSPLSHGIFLHGKSSATTDVALVELENGLSSLLSTSVKRSDDVAAAGLLLINISTAPKTLLAEYALDGAVPASGFRIKSTSLNGRPHVVIAASNDVGLLYGSFALLRKLQQGTALDGLDVIEKPRIANRLLNHWDNPDGTVERGYSGRSIFDWWRLPGHVDRRLVDYARANASIGINGTVLNNVNARAHMLSADYIAKTAAVADALRPYGIKVYLSARFSAPRDIGGLPTADPLDPAVRKWWRAKADEIYAAIPDFGGFLVKANSEGQPGPQDYGRTHADGANMLAGAIGDRGLIYWRAFVYKAENDEDRAKQAFSEFKPLDGKFASNVIVQVKNGPLDFQPREPFHPLFGAMPKTPLAIEVQITKEYLGFSTHLAYLGTLFKEVLDADTGVAARGATVADIVDGRTHGLGHSSIAGVANIGSDRNWSGSHFDQANWYAFGRLAWDHQLAADAIAQEWVGQTFTRDYAGSKKIAAMMMESREAVVDYMTPLGLAHLMGTGHHYGPAPWVDNLERADWNPAYYHRADKDGIGFNRTASGSNALAQYSKAAAQKFARKDSANMPYLLWFHQVGWTEKLLNGQPLWTELVGRYDRGVAWTAKARAEWDGLEAQIDPQRHAEVAAFLAIQHNEAKWWRDASIAYWMSINGLALPEGIKPPAHDLAYYRKLEFPDAPGN